MEACVYCQQSLTHHICTPPPSLQADVEACVYLMLANEMLHALASGRKVPGISLNLIWERGLSRTLRFARIATATHPAEALPGIRLEDLFATQPPQPCSNRHPCPSPDRHHRRGRVRHAGPVPARA